MEIVPQAKVNIVLDASKIDLFETCPARYNYRHNHNRVLPLVQKARALDKGSLLHNGFEVYFTALAEGLHYEDRMQKMLMKIRELASNPDESSIDDDDLAILLNAAEGCCDYWRAEDENTLEVLQVEQPFAYVLFEDDVIRFILSGKIDLIANVRPIGRGSSYDKLPFDHKSFSRDSVVLRKSNQFINYCAAVESNYLIVNRVGLYDKSSKIPPEKRFQRIPLSYDPVYIQSWKDNLTKMLLQEYLPCVSDNYWPEKPTSCNKFNRLCEYFDICDSSGDDVKIMKLENNYIIGEEWDVTKNMKED